MAEFPWLEEHHFDRMAHRVLFRTMLEMQTACEGIDLITLTERLKTSARLAEVGGPRWVFDLFEYSSTLSNIKLYSRMVLDAWKTREFKLLGLDLSSDREYRECPEVIERIDTAVERIQAPNPDRRDDIGTAGREVVGELKEREKNAEAFPAEVGETAIGYSTGFKALDRHIGGLIPTQLVVLAGRSGQGKTTLALNIASHLGSNQVPTLIIELEMSRREVWTKLACAHFRCSAQDILLGSQYRKRGERLEMDITERYPDLHLLSVGDLTPERLKAEIRRAKREYGCRVVIVDYLQLMKAGLDRANRNEQVAHITRSFKLLAMENDVCLVALSQLSRAHLARDTKKPEPSDLRDSGAIEQDANSIVFLWQETPNPTDDRPVQIFVAKSRMPGYPGEFNLWWFPGVSRFEEILNPKSREEPEEDEGR